MLQLDFYSTLVAASLVLLLGRWLVARIGFLRTYNIPEPVAGGLLVAMLLLALRGLLLFWGWSGGLRIRPAGLNEAQHALQFGIVQPVKPGVQQFAGAGFDDNRHRL